VSADLPAAIAVARCPQHGLHGLRSECFECNGEVEQVVYIEEGRVRVICDERDRLRAENERLRVLIGRAPHASHCEASVALFPGSCSCWKKDAATVPELVERSRALGPVMEAQGERVVQGLRDAADRMRDES
jgi:hypothetical protein